MNLPKMPTIFVKDGEQRKAYHTVEAREFIAAGWVEADETKPVTTKINKITEEMDALEEKPKAVKPRILSTKETQSEELK